jgi:hypothetical protein
MSSWCCCWCVLQVLINTVTLGVSLAVAMLMPGGAEKVYAIVGATGVHTFMLHVTAPEKLNAVWTIFIPVWVGRWTLTLHQLRQPSATLQQAIAAKREAVTTSSLAVHCGSPVVP